MSICNNIIHLTLKSSKIFDVNSKHSETSLFLVLSIPDQNFEQHLIDYGYDSIIDGQVLTSSISSITS